MDDHDRRPVSDDERTLSAAAGGDDETPTEGPVGPSPTLPGAGRADQLTRVAGFTLLRILGEGGMGVVWEAEQAQPRRRVALKLMRRDHVVDELHARMFRREAESLARLKHPSIAAIYESGHTDDGHDYFAMELVHGETLDRWLARRPKVVDPVELRLRLRLFRSICDAVHYAHQRGVIHRDLKPSNIVVTTEGASTGAASGPALPVVKILDFGLARITDADIAATLVSEIGVIKGTLQYMSPEQARGDVAAIDVRSDVYALGVMLYEMLAGRRPYEVTRAALAEAVRVICEQPPELLRSTWVGSRRLDGDLETIVGKTLEKEADRRYGSAAALAEDVERYLTSQPILARPPSAVYQLGKMIQRNRLGAAFAATVLLLLVAFGVTATVQARTIALERDRAEAEAAKAQAVNQFMRDTLSAANPWGAGYDVTVVEALDQATERISASFADQPLVEAEVRHTIGNAFSNLGRYDRAAPLLEAAAEARTGLLGRDDPETITTLAALAQLAWRDSRYDEAIGRARELLDLRRQVFGDPSSEVAVTLDFLGRVLTDAGRFEEAETVILEALAMSRAVHGEESINVAACYQNQAILEQVWRQNYALAEELSRKELRIRRAVDGRDSMDTASTLDNLGVVVMLQGRLDEAAPLIEESAALIRKLGGDRHPELARALENLGNIYFQRGEYDRVLAVLEEVLAMRREVLGDDSPDVARSLTNLGAVQHRSGKPQAAVVTLRDAVLRMEGAYGPDHPDVASTHRSLGWALISAGDLDAAEAELRTALAIAERAYPAHGAALSGFQQSLGRLLVTRGRFGEAEPLLLDAHRANLEAYGPDNLRTRDTAGALAGLYEAWGRPADAAHYRSAAEAVS
jgi:serine/threonine protein kinase/tetratricopeptide (TPR) repeat protein